MEGQRQETMEAGSYDCDVFISQCGPDTKLGFVSHLEVLLKRQNVRVFVDNHVLFPGDAAWQTMQAVLRSARIQLIVLSPGYQQSWYCMETLRIAMETPHRVRPVFFGVRPGAMDDDALVDALRQLKQSDPQMPAALLETWVDALTSLARLSGWRHDPLTE
ncbi:hypothetical protein WJX72_005946 [[Myrmecia] bisecta]|uniref:ADP-ribosyl cyclase/cyclic ADP-ribose hydrolase n=1 Tax=[Myrmecia] bisecta TaxID=41462 RepID=A0AAW1PFV3_9CHLO